MVQRFYGEIVYRNGGGWERGKESKVYSLQLTVSEGSKAKAPPQRKQRGRSEKGDRERRFTTEDTESTEERRKKRKKEGKEGKRGKG